MRDQKGASGLFLQMPYRLFVRKLNRTEITWIQCRVAVKELKYSWIHKTQNKTHKLELFLELKPYFGAAASWTSFSKPIKAALSPCLSCCQTRSVNGWPSSTKFLQTLIHHKAQLLKQLDGWMLNDLLLCYYEVPNCNPLKIRLFQCFSVDRYTIDSLDLLF